MHTRGSCICGFIPHPSWYIQLTLPAFVYPSPHLIASRPSANRRPLHPLIILLCFTFHLGRSSTLCTIVPPTALCVRDDVPTHTLFHHVFVHCSLIAYLPENFSVRSFVKSRFLRVKSLANHATVLSSTHVRHSPFPSISSLPKPASYIFILVIHDIFMTAEGRNLFAQLFYDFCYDYW